MIKKISNFIVNKRIMILVIMLLLAVISMFCSQFVEVNEDMTKYLPDSSNMKHGMDIMEGEFPEIETSNTIRVMFDDLNDSQKADILEKLSAIPNVDTVDYDAKSSDYNKENHTLYVLNLSCDYGSEEESIIESALETEYDDYTMVKNALANAFSSVASSSLTTVVGLLMLVFMSFKIGADIGIVLAKGVFISMVCVLTMLPGILLACDKLIVRTEKKELVISMDWAAKFSHKMRFVMTGLFLILFIGAYILQQQTGIAYTLGKKDAIADVFPKSNMLVMVYENQDEDAVNGLVESLENDENVKSIMGYSTILGKPYTSCELADALGDMGDDISLNSTVIDMLYYDYYSDEKNGTMTAGQFLSFVSDTVMKDETFSEYIDDDMKENVDMLNKFADANKLTKPMTADEMAKFFDMDKENINDLFLLYYIENGGVSTGSMTLPTFANFVINEVSKDDAYGSMFDEATLSKLSQLANFTDAKKMTTPYTYQKIASLLNMDADTAKLLFIYYYALPQHLEWRKGWLKRFSACIMAVTFPEKQCPWKRRLISFLRTL